jgi:hypothetical protein
MVRMPILNAHLLLLVEVVVVPEVGLEVAVVARLQEPLLRQVLQEGAEEQHLKSKNLSNRRKAEELLRSRKTLSTILTTTTRT